MYKHFFYYNLNRIFCQVGPPGNIVVQFDRTYRHGDGYDVRYQCAADEQAIAYIPCHLRAILQEKALAKN